MKEKQKLKGNGNAAPVENPKSKQQVLPNQNHQHDEVLDSKSESDEASESSQ